MRPSTKLGIGSIALALTGSGFHGMGGWGGEFLSHGFLLFAGILIGLSVDAQIREAKALDEQEAKA